MKIVALVLAAAITAAALPQTQDPVEKNFAILKELGFDPRGPDAALVECGIGCVTAINRKCAESVGGSKDGDELRKALKYCACGQGRPNNNVMAVNTCVQTEDGPGYCLNEPGMAYVFVSLYQVFLRDNGHCNLYNGTST